MAESESYQLHRAEDGAVTNERAERLALLVVDGLSENQAWKLLGGKTSGRSWEYFSDIRTNPNYKGRVQQLLEEKDAFMADDLYGEAKWMANQMWREARATNNSTMMQKAAEMRMKIAEREADRAPAPQTGVLNQRPGKPSVENPQTFTGAEGVRQKLMQIGVPQPGAVSPPPPVTQAPAPPPTQAPALEAAQNTADFEAQLARLLPA